MEQEIPVPACYFPPRLFWWYYSLRMTREPILFFYLSNSELCLPSAVIRFYFYGFVR